MKVYSNPDTYNGTNSVVTIGMFDGVHIGHKELLNQLLNKAKEIGGSSTVITFWPHPRLVLDNGDSDLQFITTLNEKTKQISRQGIEYLILMPFSKNLAGLTAEEFIKDILLAKIGMKHLVVGYNHRFGKDRVHDFKAYQKMSEELGFGISKVEAVYEDQIAISSTVIRNHLNRGEVEVANQMLGYSFSIFGTVKGGQRLGRKLGYPTANILPNEHYKLIPLEGVYACFVEVMGRRYGGMLNIGTRPTVNSIKHELSIEVHILDFSQDIYSEEVRIILEKRVRAEKKFKGLDQLILQLKQDELVIRKLLKCL